MPPTDAAAPPSCRGRYPFSLATTSFILPDDYAPNVRMLAPRFDEIELLFFEAADPAFPPPALIDGLVAVRAESGVAYNVHLPVDLPLCDASATDRRVAAARMAEVIRRSVPLAPTTLTLHLPLTVDGRDRGERRRWLARADDCVRRLTGVHLPGRRLSVETLDYPLEWVEEIVARHDLRVCLDLGHLLLAGADPAAVFDRWAPRCAIVHLHAVAGGRDHRPLDRLSPAAAAAATHILSLFRGTVSLEVFSLEALRRSLERLPSLVPGTAAIEQARAFC